MVFVQKGPCIFLGIMPQEKVFYDILERKNADP